MFMGHMSNNDFFTKLSSLFDSYRNVDHGSIYLTQKRLTYNTEEALESSGSPPINDLENAKSLPILIRASNGKSKEKKDQKIKLSTVVEADGLEEFFTRYAEVCKSGMNRMKKRDRSKAKEKLKARKKQNAISALTLESKKA
ncbi:putative signal recognition particle 14kd protein [Golovinomyces cichoracearum]|uniref:Signal recognition particle subunit SRP14 n=1 Tax=Golovinomyces cichoracearum TaxID=62708 RepID=A0A420HJ97_9PEZI|nr:putative signal recognition particle 14kd protein [Golovinomyces cichoracearum]